MSKKTRYLLAFFSFFVLGFFFAQGASALDVGTNEISNTIALSSDSPIKIAARVINIFMLTLGVIAVSLVIFAGFKWMTSGGNEEKVAAAKNILKNAIIGLLIILASWGIVAFILNRLISATGNQGGLLGGSKSGAGLGSGAIGLCTVQSVYPTPEQKDVPRNVAILINFKEDLKLDSVCVDASNNPCACDNTSNCNLLNTNNIKIFEGTDQNTASSTPAIVSYPAGDLKTLVIAPLSYLGSPSGNTWYSAYFSNDVQKADGPGMFSTCATDYFRWQFEVSNKLDLTPPQVVAGGVFPEPDDDPDQIAVNSSLAAAEGSISVLGIPHTFFPAEVDDVAKYPAGGSWNDASATLAPNYSINEAAIFSVTVIVGDKGQLYRDGNSLGVADFNGSSITFPSYLTLTVGGDGAKTIGNAWQIEVSPANAADTLKIGVDNYTFTPNVSSGYNIQALSNPDNQATAIAIALSNRQDVEVDASGNTVTVQAKVGGFAGNSITLETNNYNTFSINPMSGGADASQTAVIADKKDKPMNSTIQVNFDEPVNPITVSGEAGYVKDTIQVVNASATAKVDGQSCTQPSDCLSYVCESNACVGDYVDGKFEISNGFKTVEFRTKNECGMNGCGEKIYCLPSDSNLRVKIRTADLAPCADDDDCATKAPYSTCFSPTGGFTCGDSVIYSGQNYTTVQIGTQCWFKKNLNVGTMVNGSVNQTNNSVIEKYCYNNSTADCTTYGGLYQWNEAMQYSVAEGAQGICPSGWHIPTDAEQNILDQLLNNTTCDPNRIGVWGCADAGTKLRAGGTSGFEGLLSGIRNSGGLFTGKGVATNIWSSTISGLLSWYRGLNTGFVAVDRYRQGQNYGLSVRCIQNAPSGAISACQNPDGQNYPLSNLSPMVGVMDASFNALDGNRDGNADGPASYYDENAQNASYKDSYRWSFYINSQIDATPPAITSIVPDVNTPGVSLADPVVITFSKLMMNSTLKSGTIEVGAGETTVTHHLLNLWNGANAPTGYWTTNENLDYSPLDGQPDITRAQISHSLFAEAIDYVSQVGSGVKDIYQNCFKPSSGPNCTADQTNPSCCNNTLESLLVDGNCP